MRNNYRGWIGGIALVALIAMPVQRSDAQGDSAWHKFAGEYSIYSGALDDKSFPTDKDSKIAIYISGTAASRLFRYMGSGARIDSCVDDEETRVRDHLLCSRSKASGKTECHFGFDLRSGKSINGVIC